MRQVEHGREGEIMGQTCSSHQVNLFSRLHSKGEIMKNREASPVLSYSSCTFSLMLFRVYENTLNFYFRHLFLFGGPLKLGRNTLLAMENMGKNTPGTPFQMAPGQMSPFATSWICHCSLPPLVMGDKLKSAFSKVASYCTTITWLFWTVPS